MQCLTLSIRPLRSKQLPVINMEKITLTTECLHSYSAQITICTHSLVLCARVYVGKVERNAICDLTLIAC